MQFLYLLSLPVSPFSGKINISVENRTSLTYCDFVEFETSAYMSTHWLVKCHLLNIHLLNNAKLCSTRAPVMQGICFSRLGINSRRKFRARSYLGPTTFLFPWDPIKSTLVTLAICIFRLTQPNCSSVITWSYNALLIRPSSSWRSTVRYSLP
jgi:hypothetical protein